MNEKTAIKGTAQQQATVNLYSGVMGEIKIRMKAIEQGAMGQTCLPGAIVRELCFLQIRMICELIALGCLVAHDDIQKGPKLRKAWSADQIIKALEELHSDFYPKPVRIVQNPDPKPNDLQLIENGFLTKTELLSLYGRCGDELHRGTLNDMLSPQEPTLHFEDIKEHLDKIARLLAVHIILTRDDVHLLMGIMWDKSRSDRHLVTLSRRDAAFQLKT